MGDGVKAAIAFYRKRAGLTQDDAADAIGWSSQGEWSDLERKGGRQQLSTGQLEMVAGVVRATPQQITSKAAEISRGSRM